MEIALRRSRLARRSWAVASRMLLLVASLAFVLAVGEGALRAVYGGARPYFFSQIVEHDAQRGWRLVPGDYEFFNAAAFRRVRASINEYGIRTGDLAATSEPSRRRVTVLGDSFVFAEALSDGERFTDLLQTLLGDGAEVVNASVPGYGTGQQALLLQDLRARGFDLGDTVVHAFFTNDVLDNAGLRYETLARDRRKPVFEGRGGALFHEPVDAGPPVPRAEIAAEMARRSLVVALLRQRVELLLASRPGLVGALADVGGRVPLPRAPGVITGWYADGWEDHWERTRGVLRALASIVRSDGSDFVIAFIPSPFQVEPVFAELVRGHADEPLYAAFLADVDRPQRVLFEFCAEEGISCFDAAPALRAPRDEPAYFLHEGHLSELGSRIVAEVFRDHLEGRGVGR